MFSLLLVDWTRSPPLLGNYRILRHSNGIFFRWTANDNQTTYTGALQSSPGECNLIGVASLSFIRETAEGDSLFCSRTELLCAARNRNVKDNLWPKWPIEN